MDRLLEVCVDSVESAIAAYEGGADRLEVCANLIIGGTTPGISQFKQIREQCPIPLHILVRPRYGDFLYTENEFRMILEDIRAFKELGANGIVTGCLCADGTLDVERMKVIRKEAEGMHLTLHRAFDVCKEPYVVLEQAIEIGIDTILTSGQCADCILGQENLKTFIERAEERIHILLGGGITSENIPYLIEKTGAKHFHMSGKKCLESGMVYRNEKVNMGLPGISEFQVWRTSKTEIERAKERLQTVYKSVKL